MKSSLFRNPNAHSHNGPVGKKKTPRIDAQDSGLNPSINPRMPVPALGLASSLPPPASSLIISATATPHREARVHHVCTDPNDAPTSHAELPISSYAMAVNHHTSVPRGQRCQESCPELP